MHTFMITASSSTLKASFLTSGESWLYLGPAQARVSTATRLNCMQPQLPGRLRARTIAAGSSCPCARLPASWRHPTRRTPGSCSLPAHAGFRTGAGPPARRDGCEEGRSEGCVAQVPSQRRDSKARRELGCRPLGARTLSPRRRRPCQDPVWQPVGLSGGRPSQVHRPGACFGRSWHTGTGPAQVLI